jgi:hypothetical protein
MTCQFSGQRISFLSAIANQESLSGLETEMRKLEGIVKELTDDLGYMKTREERFSKTNGARAITVVVNNPLKEDFRIDAGPSSKLFLVYHYIFRGPWHLADPPSALVLQAEVPHRLM